MSYTIDTEQSEIPYYTASEAAQYRGVTRQHIVRMCQRGRIPGAFQIQTALWLIPRRAEGGFVELDRNGQEVVR